VGSKGIEYGPPPWSLTGLGAELVPAQ